MHFLQSILVSMSLATTAFSAPARLMSLAEEWTIESLSRTCNEEDTSCTWTFSINTHADGVEPTDVVYVVNATASAPASRAIGGPSSHGIFTVTSTWSDYFGIEDAWTTMSVIDYERGVLVYPAYLDTQLAGGEVVEPDQTYVVESIPA
ncbi:hypothetical protein S7711_06529 [Stachybotrys chartarum IBT 7711]|uniref:Small secreted protein n=1 Tax=Stachybotrys chartarum (strain CBS 109288 / IBT 7711) TaxID=1280523 RepID=A0A084B2J5_STACB|nr:hypothetical protein S7711_06529 [Stachybotrys chartarum IBT 7711]KFA54562.1 hypothetical protein S40293_02228 [Stachybotrys chartarum IBT 40293]KFA71237.1 hypothetical protein S40288_07800 [Stachybotrys chartarum IBT 40288]